MISSLCNIKDSGRSLSLVNRAMEPLEYRVYFPDVKPNRVHPLVNSQQEVCAGDRLSRREEQHEIGFTLDDHSFDDDLSEFTPPRDGPTKLAAVEKTNTSLVGERHSSERENGLFTRSGVSGRSG